MSSGATVAVATDGKVTAERIERALVTVAYIVLRHGAQYAPLLDRLEQELVAARAQPSVFDRARAILNANTLALASLQVVRPRHGRSPNDGQA